MPSTLSPADETRLARLDRIAVWMDSAVGVPGTRLRIGLDGIIGLIPGIGDAAALVPAGYIVNEARRFGAPRAILLRMAANVGIDAALGTIPLLGDIFDIGFKANRRNVAMLRRHLEAREGRGAPPR